MKRHLPDTCERPLLEQFLKAEAMALALVRATQARDVPPGVRAFLRRHEEEEVRHLQQFEQMLGTISSRPATLPRVPGEWCVLAVHLYGYESLGLQFARLLMIVRPDLSLILEDEEGHAKFFENEVRRILSVGGPPAEKTRQAAQAWRRRLPPTVDRYLHDESFAPFRADLRRSMLDAIDESFAATGL